MDYYYAEGDAQKGPVAFTDLPHRGVLPDTLVWREGMGSWQRADSVPEIRHLWAGSATSPSADTDYRPPAGPADAGPPAYGQPASGQPTYGNPGYGQPIGQPAVAPYAQPAPLLAYGGYASGPLPTNGMAIASMILGILSIPLIFAYCAGTPCAILAVVFGHLARGRARRGETAGGGMALAGLICGYVTLAVVLAVVILFAVFIAAAKVK